jgi:hypothetical protein
VTGATGLVGNNVVRMLVNRGENVRVLKAIIRYSQTAPVNREVLSLAFVMIDREHDHKLSEASTLAVQKVWGRRQANRALKLFFYLLKLRRNSPHGSDNDTVQMLKDMCATTMGPVDDPYEDRRPCQLAIEDGQALSEDSAPADSALHAVPEASTILDIDPDLLLSQATA